MQLKLELNFIEILTLVVLALFSASVFNLAGMLLTILIIITFVFLIKGKMVANRSLGILILFSITYFITYMAFWNAGIKDVITYLIAPWASYLFAEALVYRSQNKHMFTIMVIIIALGFFIHGVLNLYMAINELGLGSGYRIAFDFWRKEVISVTGCALYYVPIIGLSIGYSFFGKNKILKILSLIAFGVGVFANIVYINRTAMYLSGILITVAVISIVFKRKIDVKLWGAVVFIIILITVAFFVDLAGIRTMVLGLEITDRMQGDEVGRASVWAEFLFSDWWKYPFGGKQANIDRGFAHNLWLDVLYSVGYIPFILLTVFSVQSVGVAKSFLAHDKKNRIIYIYMVFAMLINAFVEPIIDANPYYFLSFIMIIGGMLGQSRKDNEQTNENSISQ